MNRLTILDTLKSEMKSTIISSSPNYNSDISEIQHGDHGIDEVINTPFIGIILLKDEINKQVFSGVGLDQIRILSLHLYGYMNSDGLGNYDEMFTMIEDLSYFFKYDFSHRMNTKVGKIIPYQNGVSTPYAIFDMYFEVTYEYTI